MKVISEILAVTLLEGIEFEAKRMIGILEVNLKYNTGSPYDLQLAKSNLASIERTIQILKEESFLVSELYFPKEVV